MTQTIGSESAPRPVRMTYEQFLDWEEEGARAEWVDGEVVFMSPVSERHQRLGIFLIALLANFVDIRSLGRVFYEPFQMKTGPDLPGRSPDILFVANERLSYVKKTHLEGPADLAVEIVSPESGRRDRRVKFHEYERGGVCEYWLLDPIRKRAEFYLRDAAGSYQLAPIEEDGLFHSIVLPGLWLQVDWLWQDPPPSLLDVLRAWELV